MALNFEAYYKKIILLTKKRYIMIDNKDAIKYKGVMVSRRGYCKFAKDIYKGVVKLISQNSHTLILSIHESIWTLLEDIVEVIFQIFFFVGIFGIHTISNHFYSR